MPWPINFTVDGNVGNKTWDTIFHSIYKLKMQMEDGILDYPLSPADTEQKLHVSLRVRV